MGWNPSTWWEYANYECGKAHVGNNRRMKMVQCFFRICCSSEKVKFPRCLIDETAELYGDEECHFHMFQLFEHLNPSNEIKMENDDWNDQLRDKLFEIVHSKKGRTGNIISGEYFLPLPQHITNYILIGVVGILFILVLIFRRIIRKRKTEKNNFNGENSRLETKNSKDEKIFQLL